MASYLEYFFSNFFQFTSIAATVVLWLGLSLIGSLVAGPNALKIAAPFYGWAIVSILFTLAGVFTPIPFTVVAVLIALIAVGAGIYLFHHQRPLVDGALIKIFILTTPLWLMTSGMAASQWDEFSHWLPSSLFLLETDGFPTKLNPVTGGSFPAYPYGWPLLIYLTGRIAGGFVENAGAMLNLFALLTFGLLLLDVLRKGLGRNFDDHFNGWAVIALAALLVTAFNPTFVQKLVLTAYAETSTSVTIALAGILCWMMLDKLADGKDRIAAIFAWQAALTLSLHVNIRQANVVLLVILLVAVLVAGLRDRRVQNGQLIKFLGVILVAPLIIYMTWRFHVAGALSGAEFTIRSPENWYINLIPEILIAMANVASKKGVYFILMIIVLGFGVRGLIFMQSSLDRLAIITSAMFLGYNAFLLFSYVAAFGKFDALRVASYWRYNIHAGLFGNVFAVFGIALLLQKYPIPSVWQKRLGIAALVILLIAPLTLVKKIRFDREGRKPHYQIVAQELKSIIPPRSSYFILDPKGSGEVGVITKFRLGREMDYKGVLSAFRTQSLENLDRWLTRSKPDYVLVHSTIPEFYGYFGVSLSANRSYLFKKEEEIWTEVKSWPDSTG
mgnify:CR=1 FL=1